jgi:quercetin dioxygenase-like cupin family protein
MRVMFAIGLAAGLALPAAALAQPAFNYPIPNIPGKIVTANVVSYAPGGKSPPHHHDPSAFIVAYVLEGAIRTQVNGGEIRIVKAGENFTEPPGASHDISENASATEPAKMLAIFIEDARPAPGAQPAGR